MLDEADRLYVADFFPERPPGPALRARLRVTSGRTAEAGSWAERAAA